MPHHQQVTTCRKSGGPTSKSCSCEHCSIAVCSVCGAYEGSLTTDCPGTTVSHDRQKEVYETALDYTDARGWHLGEPEARREARFEHAPPVTSAPPRAEPRATITPWIDWVAVSHVTDLQHDLARKAIAWVLADRTCEEHSSALVRAEDEVRDHLAREGLDAARELLAKLEHEKIGFHLADQRAQRCDEELHQAARLLVDALKRAP